jgi:gamma-glutamyltranspeptidase/glutathione hydrolase
LASLSNQREADEKSALAPTDTIVEQPMLGVLSMRLRIIVALFAIVGQLAWAQPAPELPSGWIPKEPVRAQRDMVAAANPLAVEAGHRILGQGGSAVDAAVAVQMVLNLVEPQSSGIGGGAFMLFHNGRNGLLSAYDGRETAPSAARPDRFLDSDGKPLEFYDAVIGGKSVGVPGTLRLLELAHRQYGKLPWSQLFEPAITLAEQGFAVSPRLHVAIAGEKHFTQERAKAYFYNPDGTPLAVGQTLRNPALAATLKRIAAEGADALYKGEMARDIVETARSHPTHPGDLTETDLAGYKARVREPVCGRYRVYKVCGMPPPSSGGITVLQILGILEPFDMKALGALSLVSVHLFAEAGRLAYADRNEYLADPDFVQAPAGLTDRAYLRERAALIKLNASLRRADAGVPAVKQPARKAAALPAFGAGTAFEFPSTSHVSIVDKYGNALAMTTTIEDAFGSRLMTKSGFLLNNELTDFSFEPLENGKPVANRVEAGKRPLSSMAPTIVYDDRGRVYMVVGSPGGSAIINYVAKTLVGVLDWGLDPQAAIALPNVGSRNGPTELERGTRAAALERKLNALGHETRVMEETSGLQAIVRRGQGWIGGTDPRREGTVAGD